MTNKHQRQQAIRAMRGRFWSPGRPSTARRQDRVRFLEAIARGLSSEDAGCRGRPGIRGRHAVAHIDAQPSGTTWSDPVRALPVLRRAIWRTPSCWGERWRSPPARSPESCVAMARRLDPQLARVYWVQMIERGPITIWPCAWWRPAWPSGRGRPVSAPWSGGI